MHVFIGEISWDKALHTDPSHFPEIIYINPRQLAVISTCEESREVCCCSIRVCTCTGGGGGHAVLDRSEVSQDCAQVGGQSGQVGGVSVSSCCHQVLGVRAKCVTCAVTSCRVRETRLDFLQVSGEGTASCSIALGCQEDGKV